jgi:hypothetical protein
VTRNLSGLATVAVSGRGEGARGSLCSCHVIDMTGAVCAHVMGQFSLASASNLVPVPRADPSGPWRVRPLARLGLPGRPDRYPPDWPESDQQVLHPGIPRTWSARPHARTHTHTDHARTRTHTHRDTHARTPTHRRQPSENDAGRRVAGTGPGGVPLSVPSFPDQLAGLACAQRSCASHGNGPAPLGPGRLRVWEVRAALTQMLDVSPRDFPVLLGLPRGPIQVGHRTRGAQPGMEMLAVPRARGRSRYLRAWHDRRYVTEKGEQGTRSLVRRTFG